MLSEQFYNPENIPEAGKSSSDIQGEISDSSLSLKRPSRAKRTLGIGLGLGLAAVGGVEVSTHFDTKSAQAAEAHRIELASNPNAKYAELLKNNLPTHLNPEDIDPRYQQIQILEHVLIPQADNNPEIQKNLQLEMAQIQDSLDQKTGWADGKRQALLNTLLQDRNIREIFQNHTDFTLTDAIQLLKGTVMNATPEKPYKEILTNLIKKQKAFSEEEIIGSHTKKFIGFNYAAKDGRQLFSGKTLAELARASMGQKAIDNPDVIKIISTGEPGEEDPTHENAGDRLLSEVEKSEGNTVLYLNTHSSGDELAIDLSNPQNQKKLKVESLVSSLLNRALNSFNTHGNLDSLGTMKIIIDGCESYDFTKNLINENFKKQYEDSGYKSQLKVSAEKLLDLMEVIPLSGEKSPMFVWPDFPSGTRALAAPENLEQIKKEGGLKGKMLLELRSKTYISGGAMSPFVPDHGKLVGLASLESQPKTFKYGDQDLQIPT